MGTADIGKAQHATTLVGSWVNGDDYGTDVEYIVAPSGDGFSVCAIDRFDGEEGAVYDVRYDAGTLTLSFCVNWESTGRFIHIHLQAISPSKAEYTYIYTDMQKGFRQGSEPAARSRPYRLRRRDGTP